MDLLGSSNVAIDVISTCQQSEDHMAHAWIDGVRTPEEEEAIQDFISKAKALAKARHVPETVFESGTLTGLQASFKKETIAFGGRNQSGYMPAILVDSSSATVVPAEELVSELMGNSKELIQITLGKTSQESFSRKHGI